MRYQALLFLLFLFINPIFAQKDQFEGLIIYELKVEDEIRGTNKYFFKDNMLRIERFMHPDSDTLKFIKIIHFHRSSPDTVYDKLDPSILSSLGDTSFPTEGYEMHIIERWKDKIELVTHHPNKSKTFLDVNCAYLDIAYRNEIPSSVLGMNFETPIQSSRWLSKEHIFTLPKGNLYSDPVISYTDPRITLQSTIEKIDPEFNQIVHHTWTAIKIQPGPLSDGMFWPEKVH